MRRTVPWHVTPEKKAKLEKLAATRTLKQVHAMRVRVVLLSAAGVPGVEIAERLALTKFTISRIRKRFEEGRVAGLVDRPKAGRGDNVTKDVVLKIVSTTMGPPPKGYSHWSTGSREEVQAQPHRDP